MKKPHLILIGLSMMAAIAGLRADIVVPGANGTDGPLVITANTEIDLSQAVTGTWDQDNTANAGKGVYDPAKWAVVFKFSSVTVNSGATVTFKNHPSRAPVVWLVNGNVTIAGTVSMNGQNGQLAPVLSEPGPGGFRGGLGSYLSVMNGGAGFGPGGGGQQGNAGGPGGYGSNGVHDTAAQRGFAYGNPSLIPLIGGSGGAGDPEFTNNLGGGAGGGAILIASQGLLTISGQIRTNGGNGLNEWSQNSGGGSGGGIRLIADTLSGSGALTAVGGTGWHISGLGRIRIERVTATLGGV
jgi:plastocyanin